MRRYDSKEKRNRSGKRRDEKGGVDVSICNKDCFHCPYPDCINDDMDHEDYVEAAERDRELRSTPEKRKLAAQQKAYREANREKVAAQQKAYREEKRKNRKLDHIF